MKIFIACSKHFYSEIQMLAGILENWGHKVSYPNSYDDPFAEERLKSMNAEEHQKWKSMMMAKDYENIAPQDAILVLNLEKKGIQGLILYPILSSSGLLMGVLNLDAYTPKDLSDESRIYT